MSRRVFMSATIGLMAATVLGCASPGSPQEATAKRMEIDAKVDSTLSRLYTQAKGSKELADKSRGILIFPDIKAAAFVVGGEYGEGALRVGGKTAEYYKTTAGSFGFAAGAQSKSLVMMFMTQAALDKFRTSNGWTAGVDAAVAVMKVGADAQIDTTTVTAPVVAFAMTNAGLMANLSIEGTKFSKLDLTPK